MELIRRAAAADLAEANVRLDGCGADVELLALCRRCLSPAPTDRPADGQAVAAELVAYRTGVEARLKQAETERAESLVREAEQRKRRRTVQVAGGAIAVVLLAGSSASLWQMFRAIDAEGQTKRANTGLAAKNVELAAQQATVKAQNQQLGELMQAGRKAKLEADTKRQEAERNLAFAKKGNEILGSVFEGLNPSANYATVAELRNALRDNLSKAAKDLERSDVGERLDVAAMQSRLGLALLGLGDTSLAVERFEKALTILKGELGPDHATTLAGMGNLAEAYRAGGQLAEAVSRYEETLEKMKARIGPDHPDTLKIMNNLALAYHASGHPAKAVPMLEETLVMQKIKLGPDHPDTFKTLHNLAMAYHGSGQLEKAVPLYEAALAKWKASVGPDDPNTLANVNNLAAAYVASGQPAKAVPLLEETLVKRKSRLGPDHPDTLMSLGNLAVAYGSSGQLAKAAPLFEETLEKRTARLGPNHPETLRAKKYLDVLRAMQTTESRYRAKLAERGPNHIDTLLARRDVAQMYISTGRLDDAELALVEVLKGMNDRDPNDAIVAFTTGLLGQCLVTRQRTAPNDWKTFNTQSLLGGALLGQKKYSEAKLLLKSGYEGMKTREKTIPQFSG